MSTRDVDVFTEIVIDRPREEVAAYASDPDNAPQWYKNIATVEWKTPRPLALGSLLAFSASFMGRTLAYVYEIVELVPGERLTMSTQQGPFPMRTTYTWESQGESTLMTLRNSGRPSGFSRVGAPLMATMMKSANNKDLQSIKAILEARPSDGGDAAHM